MSDETQPRATPVLDPNKPLGLAIEDLPSKNVAVADEPKVSLSASDHAEAVALMNLMEGRLETLPRDLAYGFSKDLDRAKAEMEGYLLRLRKLIGADGMRLKTPTGE